MHEVAATVLPDPDVPGTEIITLPGPIAVAQHRSLILRFEAILGRRAVVGIGGDLGGSFDGGCRGGLNGKHQRGHDGENCWNDVAGELMG